MHLKSLAILLVIFFFSPQITSSILASSPIKPDIQPASPVVARVYFANIADLNHLAATLDVWEVHHTAGYLIALLKPEQYASLLRDGYRVEIDPGKTAVFETSHEYLPGQASGIPGFPCYRTVEETYADLGQIALDHPDLASWVDIGDSWEKTIPGGKDGYDIYTLILTNSAIAGPKPDFYLMAAIHAREYATAELAARFTEYLIDNYGFDPDVTWLLDYYEVHITPHTNPDGRKLAENGNYWRKNTDSDDGCIFSGLWGTDLNRNSSFKWGGVGAATGPCQDTYRGPSAKSEPETQAIESYVSSIFPDQRGEEDNDPAPTNAMGTFITLHSYAQQVLFPWGHTNDEAPNNAALETLGRKFGFFNHYQVCQSGEDKCIYQTSGATDDFAYGELGVAAYTFEIGTEFFEACSSFEDTVFPDNLQALVYALKAARRPYLNPAGPETLDVAIAEGNPDSGALLTLTATADDTRYYSKSWGEEPVQNIAAARFSIDSPSWVDGTSTFPLSPVDGDLDSPIESLQATLDPACLAHGSHIVFVESEDADENWGVPGAAFLDIVVEGYHFCIDPVDLSGSAFNGETLTYSVQLTNLSTLTDSFEILASGNTWETIITPNPAGPLNSGESASLTVSVAIPDGVADGDQDLVTLTVISHGDPAKTASVTLTSTARLPSIFLPFVHR